MRTFTHNPVPARITTLYLPFFLTLLLSLSGCFTSKKGIGKWESIFNGKDLTGWTPKFTEHDLGVNYKNTFQVRDGKLVVSYDEYKSFDDKFGHLFYHEKLAHYKLRLEYRFVGTQVADAPDWAFKNSGVKFHAPDPVLIPKDQRLLVAVEAQLLGGDGTNPRPTGNVCTAGTHIEMNGVLITEHCTNSSSETYHDDQWVHLEIEVRGNEKVIHKVNGKTVLEYEKPQLDKGDAFAQELLNQGMPLMLSEGYIALQAESHPVEFRKIKLMRF